MNALRSNRKLVVVLVALVLVVAYLMVWRPRAAELSDVHQKRDELAEELAALRASTPATSAPTNEPASTALLTAIPSTPDLANLLRQLQTIAADAGVSQESLDPAPAVANSIGSGQSMVVTVSASGPRAALEGYVRRLTALERLFVVDKVDFEPAEGDGSADAGPVDLYRLDVTGRAFSAAALTAASSGSG